MEKSPTGEKPYTFGARGEKPYASFLGRGENPYTSFSDRGEKPYMTSKHYISFFDSKVPAITVNNCE